MTPSTRQRIVHVAALVGVALTLAVGVLGCGLPQDREPQKIAGALPENLRVRDNTSTSGPTRTAPQMVYFVKAGAGADAKDTLFPVYVNVTLPPNPADLPRAVVDELLKGPTVDERDKDMSSDIPANTQVAGVTQSGDTVTVDLDNLGNVSGVPARVAVAQIVFTLTSLPDVRQVMFLVNGQPISIPLDEGSSDPSQAVGRESFPNLAASIDTSGIATTPVPPDVGAPSASTPG